MPRAVKGMSIVKPRSTLSSCFAAERKSHRCADHLAEIGVLVECDPSIKAIILKIDSKFHDIVIEDLDDSTLMVKESKLAELKAKLESVSFPSFHLPFPKAAVSSPFALVAQQEHRGFTK